MRGGTDGGPVSEVPASAALRESVPVLDGDQFDRWVRRCQRGWSYEERQGTAGSADACGEGSEKQLLRIPGDPAVSMLNDGHLNSARLGVDPKVFVTQTATANARLAPFASRGRPQCRDLQ